MKTLKILFVMCVILFSASLSYSQDGATLYKIKIDKYQSWQRTGKIVILSGAAVTVIGLGLRIAATTYSEDKSDDEIVTTSYAVMGLGLATMIPGLIFHSIGKRKTKEYKIKLENLQTGFYYVPDHQGLVLRYSF